MSELDLHNNVHDLHFGTDGELILRGVLEEIGHDGRVKNAAIFFEDTRGGGRYGIDIYEIPDDAPVDPLEEYVPGSVPVQVVGPFVVLSILSLDSGAIKGIAQRVDVDGAD